jgi:hypothetical protein
MGLAVLLTLEPLRLSHVACRQFPGEPRGAPCIPA